MGAHAQVHLWKSESTCGSVGVSPLLPPCGFWASNSAHQSWCQAPLPIKPPLQYPPVRLLSSKCICVHISVLWTYCTPGQEKPPSRCAPAFATSAHSSLSWSLGSRFFSAVSLGRQPAAAPSEGGREEWSELVLVVELSEGWKLLCSGEARGRTPKS